jgi:hypothetical protein
MEINIRSWSWLKMKMRRLSSFCLAEADITERKLKNVKFLEDMA